MSESNSHTFDLEQYILHHVQNSGEWQLPFFGPIPLPEFLSLHSLMILIWAMGLLIIFCFLYKKNQIIPTGLTNLLESFIIFIRDDIAITCLGKEDGRRMTPLFCTFFFFILGLNLMGLIPLFSTATANISVTGALASITLGFMIFGSIYRNGLLGFLKSFVPSGIPLPILIILVPIEFLGIFIKAFALMIRLFANMLAGHIIIVAMVGLVGLLGYIALPTVALAVFISLLEVLIAFIQTYIFTFLSAMFMGMTFHPQHE